MTTQPTKERQLESCTAEELSVDGIRKRAAAFNQLFERNGGYKAYETQALDVLLVHVDELRRDNASYANAHKTLLEERDKAQQLAMRQAAQIKRMSAGETDPPHCPSCDCPVAAQQSPYTPIGFPGLRSGK